MKVIILPGQALEVSWVPTKDASLSPIIYTITTIKVIFGSYVHHSTTSVAHPVTMTMLTGLPQHSAGRVSVQAMNPGAVSDIVSVDFKMVDIDATASGISFYIHNSRCITFLGIMCNVYIMCSGRI